LDFLLDGYGRELRFPFVVEGHTLDGVVSGALRLLSTLKDGLAILFGLMLCRRKNEKYC